MALSEDEMNATQEQLNKLTDNLGQLNKVLESINGINSGYGKTVNQNNSALKNNTENVSTSSNALKSYEKAIDNARNGQEKIRQSVLLSAQALDSFIGATLSTQKGMTKYTGTLTTSVSAIATGLTGLALFFGRGNPLILAITAIASVINTLITGNLKMNQSALEARDSLYKIGGVGAFTTKELLLMGESAKLSAQELDVLVTPLKNLKTAVMTLGDTAGDGMMRFGKVVANLTDNEIMQYRKVGLEYGQLTESMSEYINLQYAAGIQINSRFKTEDQLKKASLQYVDNLLELSALTGKDIDTVKKEQQAALMAENFQIRMFRLQEEGERLSKSTNEADRERGQQLLRQAEQSERLISGLSTAMPGMVEGVREFIAAGGVVVGEASSKLMMTMGEEFLPRIQRELEQGTLDTAQVITESRNKMEDVYLGPLGEVMTKSTDALRIFGVGAENAAQIIATAGLDYAEMLNLVRQQIADMAKTGIDTVAATQANLESMDRLNKLLAQDFYNIVDGPVMTALNFLADAARTAARWISSWTTEGSQRLAEEDRRERQQNLLSQFTEQSAQTMQSGVPESVNQLVTEKLIEEKEKLITLMSQQTQLRTQPSINSIVSTASNFQNTDILNQIEKISETVSDLENIKNIVDKKTPTTTAPVNTPTQPTPTGEALGINAEARIAEEQQRAASIAANQPVNTTPTNRDDVTLLSMIDQKLSDMITELKESNTIQEKMWRNTA